MKLKPLRFTPFFLLISATIFFHSCGKTTSTSQEAEEAMPKNIIFLVGDGMGLTQITAGLIANGNKLNLERCPVGGFSKTWSADNLITDSAAGATAFSCGKKTYNTAIGVDTDTLPMPTILEIAEDHGLATGLVATSSVTHATPASFIAHQPSRYMNEEIAMDFLKTDVNVFIGGGLQFFYNRTDSLNLLDSLKENAYRVVTDMTSMTQVEQGKLAALVAPDGLPKMSEGRGDYLPNATNTAINLLDDDPEGFFLMVEGSQIDWGGHYKDSPYIMEEMIDFDKAIGAALDFAEADGNTLVVITADHECGGYAITGGDLEKKTVTAHFTSEIESCTTDHTASMVPVFAYGPGAEKFGGIMDNTEIFDKFLHLLKLDEGAVVQE